MIPVPSTEKSDSSIQKSLVGFVMFSGLKKAELAELAEIAVRLTVPKGGNIFMEGTETLGFYLVESGRVKVYKLSSEGKEHILHIIEPGSSFAEACIFFQHATCPASADAIEEAHLIFFPKDRFLEKLKKSSTLAMRMMGSMAEWIRLMAEQVGGLSLSTVEGRLVRYLVVLARRGGEASFTDGATVTLDVEKGVLAARLGTIPETLSRTLKKLQDKGLLKVDRSKLTVLDSGGLIELLQ